MTSYINVSKVRGLANDKLLKLKKANTSKNLCNELSIFLGETKTHLEDCCIEKTSNWLLQHDLWLQNERGLLTSSFYNYGRGDIVFSVELGTSNIGTEIRYPHPCIVVYDNSEDWLIVVPITGAQIDKCGNPIIHLPFEIFVPMQTTSPANPKEFQFKKPSVIQVDQIQRISKYRILNKMSLKLRVDLLNQIDNIINEHYSPSKKIMMDKLKQKLTEEEEKNKKLLEDLIDKENEIYKLHKEVKLLKTKIS
ncbi:MAG: type II toxin-antitoxin system PemK/MazF family toxin [Clostridiales bacterium]|nr:type II toxin-antitoxin system PemK/MazF family toxin [Clostridiales bacterium]